MLLDQNHIITQKETEHARVSLRNDGIVHVFFKPNMHMTRELQMELVDMYWEVASFPRPFLFEAGEFVSISKEARTNALNIEDTSPIGVSAVVVKNLAQRIIADYYYRFNKPKRQIRIFKNSADAISWLLTHDQKEIGEQEQYPEPGKSMHN